MTSTTSRMTWRGTKTNDLHVSQISTFLPPSLARCKISWTPSALGQEQPHQAIPQSQQPDPVQQMWTMRKEQATTGSSRLQSESIVCDIFAPDDCHGASSYYSRTLDPLRLSDTAANRRHQALLAHPRGFGKSMEFAAGVMRATRTLNQNYICERISRSWIPGHERDESRTVLIPVVRFGPSKNTIR